MDVDHMLKLNLQIRQAFQTTKVPIYDLIWIWIVSMKIPKQMHTVFEEMYQLLG